MHPELKQRVVTAGVLAGVLLIGLGAAASFSAGRWWLMALAFLVCGLAAFEFARICAGTPPDRQKGTIFFLASFLPALGQFALYAGLPLDDPRLAQKGAAALLAFFFLSELGGVVFTVVCARRALNEAETACKDLSTGIFLVGFCGGALMALCMHPRSFALVSWLVLTVCANDIAAYFTGKKLGGPKLSPKISPQKTISGSAGGILAGMLAGIPTAGLLPGALSWTAAAGLTLAVVCAAQLGDLLKSYLKRLHGVKDSGAILPGHGGVLDRTDALLMAAPLLFCWLIWKGV